MLQYQYVTLFVTFVVVLFWLELLLLAVAVAKSCCKGCKVVVAVALLLLLLAAVTATGRCRVKAVARSVKACKNVTVEAGVGVDTTSRRMLLAIRLLLQYGVVNTLAAVIGLRQCAAAAMRFTIDSSGAALNLLRSDLRNNRTVKQDSMSAVRLQTVQC